MKEGLKRSIYHELATHDVVKSDIVDQYTKFHRGLQYTFGQYRIENHYDYIIICEYYKGVESFVNIKETIWDEDDSEQDDTYLIYTAAKNKAEGKPYTDPYKMSKDATVKDSTKRFKSMMLQKARDFLPYDMSRNEQLKVINKMKSFLTHNLKKHYTTQK